MKKQLMLILFGCMIGLAAKAQNITRIEYYFDTDPGFGNATPVTFTAAADIANLNFSPSIAALTAGTHRLFVRSFDATGKWSITNTHLFYKATNTTLTNITRIEYYFDTDPGFGLGTAITFTQSTDVANINFTPSIAALSEGTHRLFVRSLDATGNWSVTNSTLFYKVANATLSNITRLEYFFDTDPGFGNGTALTIVPSTNIADAVFNIYATPLSLGIHNLFVRSLDANGSWSITNVYQFTKTPSLPVTLLNFGAALKNTLVSTTWQTSTEVNTSHFNVQRSTDGASFTSIGKVTATGIGATSQHYHFADNQMPNVSTIYYRLQMVDKDGSFTYSSIVAITLNGKASGLTIFPNPVKETLFVQIASNKAQAATLQIVDMEGKVLQQQQVQLAVGNTSVSINTSTLVKGSYLLVVKGEVMQQKQFVKE